METYGEKLAKLEKYRPAGELAQVLGITDQAYAAYAAGTRVPRDEIKQRIQKALLEEPNFFKEGVHNKCTQRE